MAGPGPRPPRAVQAALFVWLLGSYAYFFQGVGAGDASRFDLVRALAERHTLVIDAYHHNTTDEARRGDHFYSDKAPGLSVLGAPLHALLSAARAPAPDRAAEHDLVVASLWLMTVLLAGVATAGTGVLVLRLAVYAGASVQAGALAAVAYGLGTLAFPFATVFVGHAMAGFLLFLAFSWLLVDEAGSWRSLAAGLAAGLAAACDYGTLPAVALLLLAAPWGAGGRRRGARFVVGAVLPLVGLAVYLGLAFGSPVRVGAHLLADPASARAVASAGWLGLARPRGAVVAQMLISGQRGLLLYCPVTAVGALGFLWTPRRGPARRPLFLSALVVALFVAVVSGYAWWDAGSIIGSRFLVPMLPFLCWPVALLATHVGSLVGGLATISTLLALLVTAVQPVPIVAAKSPFFDEILPGFRDGHVAHRQACPLYGEAPSPEHHAVRVDGDGRGHDAFNVGQRLGLPGLASLLPLLLFWGAMGALLARLARGGGGVTADGASSPRLPLVALAALAGLGASGCGSRAPPGTPVAATRGWVASRDCRETGVETREGDVAARLPDAPGPHACGFAGTWLAVHPGSATAVTLEIEDGLPDEAPGVVEHRLRLDGRYVWTVDPAAADGFAGWQRVTYTFTPRWPVVELRVEAAMRAAPPTPAPWFGRAGARVRNLQVAAAGASATPSSPGPATARLPPAPSPPPPPAPGASAADASVTDASAAEASVAGASSALAAPPVVARPSTTPQPSSPPGAAGPSTTPQPSSPPGAAGPADRTPGPTPPAPAAPTAARPAAARSADGGASR